MNISEAAVFKWVVIVVVVAASVIGVTLLTRPLVGAILGLVVLCAGLWHGYRWLRRKKTQS